MKKFNLATGIFSAALLSTAIFMSCKKEQPQTPQTLNQTPDLPEASYDYSAKHGVNSNIATLGRVLFYDQNLSVNNAVSCGSCHKQQFAFADNVRVNKGFNGQDLKRNSPSIQGIRGFLNKNSAGFIFENGSWVTNPQATIPTKDNQAQVLLFWDGRQSNVADMVLNPILNHNEMNLPDFETLTKKISEISYYPGLFQKAFGDAVVNKERIAFALEGFIACLNTDATAVTTNNSTSFFPGNSTLNADDANLTEVEKQGKFLFHNKYNCATCHDPSNTGEYGAVTSPSQMFNIGLDEVYSDNGLGQITNKAGDKGLFKVPTLKNISLTAPYMHDGRFNNLGEVIDHYSHGIKQNENLSFRFLNFDGTAKKLNIVPAEKSALIAFLNTLKDDDFLTSPMYSDPFKK